MREKTNVVAVALPDSTKCFGRKEDLDPIYWLLGAAYGWGGLPVQDSAYTGGVTEKNDGKTPYTLTVNGEEVGQVRIERSVPAVHTASESFDVGSDLGSPVALDYYDRAPFKFNGKIEKINIRYLETGSE